MPLTSTERDYVEHMAQEQFRYAYIFEEQRKVLQKDEAKYIEAIAKTRQLPFVAKSGRRWEPTQDKVDEYLAKCDEICRSVPRDIEEGVKIMFVAHAALVCMVTVKTAYQRECVKLAILRRRTELWNSIGSPLTGNSEGPSESNSEGSIESNSEGPISKPSVEPRRITPDDLRLFEIPDNLHGKQFLLSPDSDESCMYEIIGYSRKRDKTVVYDVLFDDCEDPFPVDKKEMMGMLEDSLYFPA